MDLIGGIVFFLLLGSFQVTVSQTDEYVTVTTANGDVFGYKEAFKRTQHPIADTTVDIFKGIPFAKPPIGKLRFKRPEAVEDWAPTTLNATTFKPQCWQLFPQNFTEPQDEDCLYVNIWSPDVKRSNIPVMVWIHGGGFVFGSTFSASYDGRALVALNDVVMVSLSYRLGVFGFLATGDEELRGNFGLWDQNEALKWIKTNIAAFGGDPNRITIFGQSAGGASVGFQLIGEPSWTYFHRAIPISGNMMSPWALLDIDEARKDAFQIGRLSGCGDATTSAALADCLRDVGVQLLTAASNAVMLTTTTVLPLVPVIDGEFITDDPRNLLAEGKFKKCNLIVGNTLDDGSLIAMRGMVAQIPRFNPYADYDKFRETIEDFTYIYRNDIIVDSMEQEYIDWTQRDDPDANYFFNYLEIATDEGFHCPSEHTARVYAQYGVDVYRYTFTQRPSQSSWSLPIPTWKGVAHSEDLIFIFGYDFNPDRSWRMTRREVDLSLDIMRYYTNFAKSGDPNIPDDNDNSPGGEAVWPKFEVPGLISKDLSVNLEDMTGFKADQCHFWNSHAQELVSFSGSMSDAELQWREEFNKWRTEDLPQWRASFSDYQENINCS